MINPRKITDFNRTDGQLEEFLLFAIFVAGKRSDVTAKKLNELLTLINGRARAFEAIRQATAEGTLLESLMAVKMGKYNMLMEGLPALAASGVDLRACSPAELEKFKGIGLKSSRFFILHSRDNARVSALDTHILSWLREKGYNAPSSTPTSARRYEKLEDLFLFEADQAKMKPSVFDLEIWKSRQVRKKAQV